MALLPILIAPHPLLKKVAEPVSAVNAVLRRQMDDMLESMYDDKGIGLAAPQVGISNRILVLDVEQASEGAGSNPIFMVNPEIIYESEELHVYDEGCLSLPGMFAEVERPKIVRVKYIDYDGKEQEVEADNLFATCLQHEIDHLNGILFVDHISALKRNLIIRKLKKAKKHGEAL